MIIRKILGTTAIIAISCVWIFAYTLIPRLAISFGTQLAIISALIFALMATLIISILTIAIVYAIAHHHYQNTTNTISHNI